MRKKNLTVKATLAIFACAACVNVNAQKKYPEPEPMTPGMSEYWTPQPKVVTPGTETDNAVLTAPSDAIVLFDGKDLSAWENREGKPAGWIVNNGVMTVDKKNGRHPNKTKIRKFPVTY